MTKQSKNNPYQDIEHEYDMAISRKYNKWMNRTSETPDQPAFTNYVNKLIDQKGGGSGPAPTPTGGGKLITIPVVNTEIKTIPGAYAVNLIDYRELSKDHRIGVGGKTSVQDPHQRLLYTLGKQTIDSVNSKYYAGGQLGMSGVKKNKQLTLDYHWVKKPRGGTGIRDQQATLILHVDDTDNPQHSTFEEKKINSDTITGSEKWQPAQYGFYKLGLGSTNKAYADNCSVHFQAYYGDFKPKGVRRDFQFKKFNNYELLSNGTQKDQYITGQIFDQIDKQLDKVKLKDLRWHIGLTGIGQLGAENYFAIECPENIKKPSSGHSKEQESKEIGAKCLTNNLCEIPPEDEQHHQHEKRPYFVTQLTELNLPDDKGIKRNVWCWIIMINPTLVWNWINLLKETEVVYPIENAGKIHVPAGGYVLNLTNGSKVQSNLYKTVTGTTDDCYLFSQSPFGFDDIKVPKHQIVSVTPNYP